MERESTTFSSEKISMPVVRFMRRIGHIMIQAAERRKDRILKEQRSRKEDRLKQIFKSKREETRI